MLVPIGSLQRAVVKARLTPSRPELVMVPFDAVGDALGVAGASVRIPRLLLTGGPELDAQRATVFNNRTGSVES